MPTGYRYYGGRTMSTLLLHKKDGEEGLKPCQHRKNDMPKTCFK